MKIRATTEFFSKIWKQGTGFFVEIGAYDGTSKNSTAILEGAGWQGVCIEAHPERFRILESRRKCRCINAAIYNRDGVVDFAIMPEGKRGWDGIVETLNDAAKQYLDQCDIIKVPAKQWNSLGLPQIIDYLQIDVEGAELEILETIDFKKNKIKYICIEDNRLFHSNGTDHTYRNFLENKGFKHIAQYGVDHIYKKEYQ